MRDALLTKEVEASASGASVVFDTLVETPAKKAPTTIECYTAGETAVTSATVEFEVLTCDTNSATAGDWDSLYEGTITAGDFTANEDIFGCADIDVKGVSLHPIYTKRFIKVSAKSADNNAGQIKYKLIINQVTY